MATQQTFLPFYFQNAIPYTSEFLDQQSSRLQTPGYYRFQMEDELSIFTSQLFYYSFDQSHASIQTFTLLIKLPRQKLPYGLQGFFLKQTWTQDHHIIPQHRPCPNLAKLMPSIRSQHTIMLPIVFQNKITILRVSLFFQNPVQYVNNTGLTMLIVSSSLFFPSKILGRTKHISAYAQKS